MGNNIYSILMDIARECVMKGSFSTALLSLVKHVRMGVNNVPIKIVVRFAMVSIFFLKIFMTVVLLLVKCR